MGGASRRAIAAAAIATALSAAAAPAYAQTTRFASPSGTNADPCTQADPCDLITATDSSVVPGDVVRMVGGAPPGPPFAMGPDQVFVGDNITLRGAAGARPVITSSAAAPGILLLGPGSVARDLVLEYSGASLLGALALQPGALAERVEIDSATTGCRLVHGTTIRDSVCSGAQHGVLAEPTDTAAVNLRNVTAVGDIHGINADTGGAGSRTVNATNVIAFGGSDVDDRDIRAQNGMLAVNLDFSNWNSQLATAPATITDQDDAGSVGNVALPPVFVNPAGGDFRQAETSAGTIDRGTATGLLAGELDFEGDGRFLGAAPDIGADEFVLEPPPSDGSSTSTVTSTPIAVPTGEQEAALKRCKRKAKKQDWSKKRLKRCRRNARKLPV